MAIAFQCDICKVLNAGAVDYKITISDTSSTNSKTHYTTYEICNECFTKVGKIFIDTNSIPTTNFVRNNTY